MNQITIPSRPFATESLTGMMLPDGFFVNSLGKQQINAHFRNQTQSQLQGISVYIESTSDPNIELQHQTHEISRLNQGASHHLSWDADFNSASSGIQWISFIVDYASRRERILKKIFVVDVTHDPITNLFTIETPEYLIEMGIENMFQQGGLREDDGSVEEDLLSGLSSSLQDFNPEYLEQVKTYLPRQVYMSTKPKSPYQGKHGPLPFQDPAWKIIGLIILGTVLVAGLVRAAEKGKAPKVTTTVSGSHDFPYPDTDCNPCDVRVGVGVSGSTSDILASIMITVGGLGTAACIGLLIAGTDFPDMFWRGQEQTVPAENEWTVEEEVKFSIGYPEDIVPGKEFKVNGHWEYKRNTTGQSYSHSVSETNKNQHLLSHYEVDAPEELELNERDELIVTARFYEEEGELYTGNQLLVRCLLVGPNGQFYSGVMQDNGITPDEDRNDGIYTFDVSLSEKFEGQGDLTGDWFIFTIAQDVNTARSDMDPTEAAKIVGGILLTDQAQIKMSGGDCEIQPDAHVNVR